MTIKRYKLKYDWMHEVIVEIDDEKCTDDLLHEINNFWSDAEYRLDEAKGNILNAVLTMLCTTALILSIQELNAQAHLAEGKEEGWPPLDGSHGIKIISVDQFEFDPEEVEIKEVAA